MFVCTMPQYVIHSQGTNHEAKVHQKVRQDLAGEVLKNPARSPGDTRIYFTRFVWVSGGENGNLPSNLSEQWQKVSLSFEYHIWATVACFLRSLDVNYSAMISIDCKFVWRGYQAKYKILFTTQTATELSSSFGASLQHEDRDLEQ